MSHRLARIVLGTAFATLVGFTTDVSAGPITFSTTGYFSSPFASCNQGAGGAAASVSCTGGGVALTFTGEPSVSGTTPDSFDLGTFLVGGIGFVTIPPNTVEFSIVINQSVPTAGSATLTGFLSGSVNSTTNVSTLVWTPTSPIAIGDVTYAMGGVSIPYGETSIQARATSTADSVPEPTTALLAALGLAGMGVRRLRRRTAGTAR